jgi:hypothetical protein
MRQRKLSTIETKQKLEETTKRLRVIEEKNLELRNVISEIDCQGKELRSIICTKRKTIKKQELLLKANIEIKQ